MIRKLSLVFTLVCFSILVACGGGRGTPQTASFAASPFAAGIAHVAGNYGFTDDNYLVEGAKRIQQLGSKSIFVYMTPEFRDQYPDRGAGMWNSNPSSLAQLAQTAPYAQLFSMPFKTFVVTAYTFTNEGFIDGMSNDSGRQKAEENEFYTLAKYLYSKYAGTGKNFILKNWEGDWIGLGDYDPSHNILPNRIVDMTAWLSARQRGVLRARSERGSTDVSVLNAVEVNRVLDSSEKHMKRLINTVVPQVKADMVTYSSYDSTSPGKNADELRGDMTEAINTIDQLAPDPLNLGRRRILISEYGMFENERNDLSWRADVILSTAKSAGLAGAFLWNVFDNECKQSDGQPAAVGLPPGAWGRPKDGQCRGLWAIRPDGSTSNIVGMLKKYW